MLRGDPITLTDPEMTRFVMTLPESVDLVLHAFTEGKGGDLFVQKAPAATVRTLAEAVLDVLGKPDHPVKVIGTRHGEKLYEALLSREEMVVAKDQGRYYRVPPDNRDLNYSAFESSGDTRISAISDYNSHNTERLERAGMADDSPGARLHQAGAGRRTSEGRRIDARPRHRRRGVHRQEPLPAPQGDEAVRGPADRGRFDLRTNCVRRRRAGGRGRSPRRRQPPAGSGRVHGWQPRQRRSGSVHALEAAGRRNPIILTSSIQAESDNPYGVSKKAAEEAVLAYAERTGASRPRAAAAQRVRQMVPAELQFGGGDLLPQHRARPADHRPRSRRAADAGLHRRCGRAASSPCLRGRATPRGFAEVEPVYRTTVGEVAA